MPIVLTGPSSSLLRRTGGYSVPINLAAPYSTSFSSTEDPISEGGIWTNGNTDGLDWQDVKTTGGIACAAAFPTPGIYDDSIAHLKTSYASYTGNQYAEATVSRAGGYDGGGHEIELLVRFAITANNARGYEVYISIPSNEVAVVKWLGPVGTTGTEASAFTVLATTNLGTNVADGDVFRFEVTGSSNAALVVKRNGSTVHNLTDSSSPWLSGQPGMGFMPWGASAVLASYGWTSWSAGNL